MSGRIPAATRAISIAKATIGTPRELTLLLIAPVGPAAMERRHNGRRENHRNEGQGKKQVNHEGKSPNKLPRMGLTRSA